MYKYVNFDKIQIPVLPLSSSTVLLNSIYENISKIDGAKYYINHLFSEVSITYMHQRGELGASIFVGNVCKFKGSANTLDISFADPDFMSILNNLVLKEYEHFKMINFFS